MSDIIENPEWPTSVDQIDTSDKVLGGPDGVINKVTKQLADRTAYLKQEVESVGDLASSAEQKADDALGQITSIEESAGSAVTAAQEANQHRIDALAAAALADESQGKSAADASQAYTNAMLAAQASGTAQQKAAESSSNATVAQGAANLAVGAKDAALAARDRAIEAEESASEDADAVAAIKTEIRNWYYGPLEADPVTRPDGTPVQVGDEYHSTVSLRRRVFNGSAWEDFIGASTADLANATDPAKGAGMVGFLPPYSSAVEKTAADIFSSLVVSPKIFMTPAQVADVESGTAAIDVSVAIQKALDTGANVDVSGGKFLVGTTLQINHSGQKLSGDGYIKSAVTGNNVINIIDKEDVEVSGITIENADFPATVSANLMNSIFVLRCKNINIFNNKIVNKPLNAGIYINQSTDSRVFGNYITCSGLTPDVLGSRIPASIVVGNGSCRVSVSANNIYICGIGIIVDNVSYLVTSGISITGNTIAEAAGYGIASYAGGSPETDGNINDVTIHSNVITRVYGSFYNTAVPDAPYSHGAGIYVLNGRNITVMGNTVRDCNLLTSSESLSPAGIGVVDAVDCVISGNSISNPRRYGIISDGENLITSSNVIVDSIKSSLYSRKSKGCVWSGNSVRYTEDTAASHGILLFGLSSVHMGAAILGNSFKDTSVGVYVTGAVSVSISNNSIRNSNVAQNQSILASSDCSGLVVSDNIIECLGGIGMQITATRSHIKGNVINGSDPTRAISAIGADSILGFNRIGTWSASNKGSWVQLPPSTFLDPVYYAENGVTISLTSAGTIEGVVVDDTARQIDVYISAGSGSTLVHQGASSGGLKFRNKSGANINTDGNSIYHYRSYGNGVLYQV